MPDIVLEDAVRPLNPHEISKVFCSILAGVAAVDPDQIESFESLVVLARELQTTTDTLALVRSRARIHARDVVLVGGDPNLSHEIRPGTPTWRTAFSATVAGFCGWCNPLDVELALTWVAQNVRRIFPVPRVPVYS